MRSKWLVYIVRKSEPSAYYGMIGGLNDRSFHICTGGEKQAVMYYLLLSRSLTHAQRTAKTLERAGITAIVTRVPKSIAIDGCGYCVKVSGRSFTNALVTLKNAEMYPNRVFVMHPDGNMGEVGL